MFLVTSRFYVLYILYIIGQALHVNRHRSGIPYLGVEFVTQTRCTRNSYKCNLLRHISTYSNLYKKCTRFKYNVLRGSAAAKFANTFVSFKGTELWI